MSMKEIETLPATCITTITKKYLSYIDKSEIERNLNLLTCRDNWFKRYNKKETLIDKLMLKRIRCKNVGDRFIGIAEAYFIFYGDINIKFIFNINQQIDLDDACEAINYIEFLKQLLKDAGWLTFDIA